MGTKAVIWSNTMTRNIYIQTEDGRTEHATNWTEAKMHWDMLEANGYIPVEFTGESDNE